MDYNQVRARFASSEAQAQTVSVNHRSLITRTLTKYPVDYALYRELLQNSADAKASTVVISFETSSVEKISLENINDIHSCSVGRLTVKNNGQLFREEDWNRLREIAKGNPDESKIGAFGVGFYSVFELTDEPLVHSGSEILSFYYEGDQLRYQRDSNAPKSPWTVIDLPYRTPGQLPDLAKFSAFLTQSFMLVPLQEIKLQVDNTLLLHLKKTEASPQNHQIPRHLNTKSPDGTLQLNSWTSESFQVQVWYLNVTQMNEPTGIGSSLLGLGMKLFSAFAPSSKDPAGDTVVTCFLRRITGNIDVKISSQFSQRMKATVMKAPPKKSVITMLTHSRDEKNLSELEPPLSDYIFPREFNDAKVFIGFPTKQSTGMRTHVALNQLIPTMERTAVDMSNNYVKDWNQQLLFVAGVLSRIVYEHEMSALSTVAKSALSQEDSIDQACYIMKKFEFNASTPDPAIGAWISYGFWSCATAIQLPTQLGIKFSNEVRLAPDTSFVETIPIIPEKVIKSAPLFIKKAVDFKYLANISIADIRKELEYQTLSKERLLNFLVWCANGIRTSKLSTADMKSLFQSTVISGNLNATIPLGNVSTYQNKFVIPESFPVPLTTLPFDLIRNISLADLELFGWKELSIASWIEYLVSISHDAPLDQNLSLSPKFSISVLECVYTSWAGIDNKDKKRINSLLSPINCIPTQLGMKRLSESYFEPIKLFPELPIKTAEVGLPKHFLTGLGMRESVDVAVVLRLINNPESNIKWSTIDVIKYLSLHQRTLLPSDWQTLRVTPFIEAVNGGFYKADELYSPDINLKSLGFNIIKWDQWHDSFEEAKLLYLMGLRQFPAISDLLSQADQSETKSRFALRYYISHYDQNRYDSKLAFETPYKCIPCVVPDSSGDKKIKLFSPGECFSGPQAVIFGLPVVDKEFGRESWKLGVPEHPDFILIAKQIADKKPASIQQAEEMFAYLSTRIQNISFDSLTLFKRSEFIPIKRGKSLFYRKPGDVFFAASATLSVDERFYNDFFDFANYSEAAKPFLSIIGVREKPGIKEIVTAAIGDPVSMYNLSSSPLRYERLMENIANKWDQISSDRALVQKMQRSSFLLACTYSEATDEIADSDNVEYSLAKASEIAIVDDVIYFNVFKSHVKTAPQQSSIERMYEKLGAPKISSLVEERQEIGRAINDTAVSQFVKTTVVERSKLFLESTRDKVKVKPRDIESLSVVVVTDISIRRRAANTGQGGVKSISQATSACIAHNPNTTLYVTQKYDWYEVSQALIKLLLQKPSPDSVIVLESFLSSNLRSLQRRGFNVRRLLKKQQEKIDQEAEAKRLETVEKLRMQSELKKRRSSISKESNSEMNDSLVESANSTNSTNGTNNIENTESTPLIQPPMLKDRSISQPNAVSGQGTASHPRSERISKTLVNRLKTSLFSGNQNAQQRAPQAVEQTSAANATNGVVKQQPGISTGNGIGSAISALQAGIKASRPYTSNSLRSQKQSMPIPDQESIEQACDSSVAEHLNLAFKLPGGPNCFTGTSPQSFDKQHLVEATRFRHILTTISTIFGCSWDSISMFLEYDTNTTAFNAGGSLFFNLKFFLMNSDGTQRPAGSSTWDPIWALDYWYPVFAHELAHSIVGPHGSQHSYYSESYVQHFMENFKTASLNIFQNAPA